MSAYDGRVTTPTGAPAYTARPGRAFAPPPAPPRAPRCSCADSRHHTPGLACDLPLDTETERTDRYCQPCALLRSTPLPYEDHPAPPPALITHSAQTLARQLINAGHTPDPRLITLTEETDPMTPDTRAAINDATATPAGPPATVASTHPTGLTGGFPITDRAADAIADLVIADADLRGHRPQADNVAPANTREEEPLPVLLDRLARATAAASAVKAVVDDLRPRVEAAAIRRHAEEGTDRYRRADALVTLRFAPDRIVVEDEPGLRELVPAWAEDLDTYRAEVKPGSERQLYDDLITVGGALLDAPAGARTITIPTELAERLVEAVLVTRELDPDRALRAVEEELGATVTKSGLVVADTGEPVTAIRVERGRPSGVQVRADSELKAAALADVRAFLA